ncbi:hypothetical protein FIBSPDRAFT_1028522 [Athelia psychrophila]|uniref:Crinkler effector protein N-terminal domain-containing protein n=1 Tax=Athelia psychrophila TaxID=1759441 RepID=A0A166GRR4_9AGAM|nr:hypothetical protein FIBSPDRAFT_1028522 [Fibularhizoctonia sp. CBS 109695]
MVKLYIVIVGYAKKLLTSSVKVLPEATVDELKKKVVKDKELDVPASRLIVWQCKDQKALDGLDELEPGDAHERLQSIFSDKEKIVRVGENRVVSTRFSDDEILVVEIVEKENPNDDRKRKELDDKEDSRKRLRTAIRKAAPLSLAVAKKFKTISGPNDAIGCNRPFENDTIPINLLDQTFGLFKDRCRKPPSTKAMTLLIELASAACEWYKSEDLREQALCL